MRRPESWVFLILLGSYAFFWQARDWNSASRLMLTYALVDRGTVAIDGLERQTHDIARLHGHYYTDKLPGFSMLAILPYAVAKALLRLPGHPLHGPGLAYWPADYWVTLGTSGLLTALAGAWLTGLARDLGCGPKRSALVGLAYGLATPAYAYATLSYGHQTAASALLGAFALLWRTDADQARFRRGLAGFLAAFAAVVEIQVGPVSAILGLYLLAQVFGRRRKPVALAEFALGALAPTLLLVGYNEWAFGAPWDMGYFHLIVPMFRAVHSADNPLGLNRPDARRASALLWGDYQGLLFYAPIVLLALPGWVALARRRYWGMAVVSALTAAVVFAVNVSYPPWTGGWTTGPRLLVPLLPFALLPVAALLAAPRRWVAGLAAMLALAGGIEMLLFVGVGARIPHFIAHPLVEAVWPLWTGAPRPEWATSGRFARNLVALACPETIRALPGPRQWVQFVPLIAAQALAIALMCRFVSGPVDPKPEC